MRRALLASALLARASLASADPAVFTAAGHAVVPASALGDAGPGCAVSVDGAHGRLVARDAMDDWAVVLLDADGRPRSVPVFASEVPEPGAALRVRGGGRVVVVAASAGSYALRRAAGEPVAPGAVIVDEFGRWVAMARGDTAGETFEALALAPIRGELRTLAGRAVPTCGAAPAGSGGRPGAPRATCAPRSPGPARGSLALARNALRRNGSALMADIAGDRFVVARGDRLPEARTGCALDALRVWRLDAATGLALLRREDTAPHAGIPLSELAPEVCATLFAVDVDGAVTPAVVLAATDATVRVRAASAPSSDDLALIDARGALVAMVTARAGEELVAARVTAVARFLATVADPREPPRCAAPAAAPTAPEVAASAPEIPDGAVIPLGVAAGAVAVHVAADGVYATLANHLSDVSNGCVVRRPGRRSEEVLTVDAPANVALFHALAATQLPDGETRRSPLPAGEDPPLPLADRRPAERARVWVGSRGRALAATVASQSSDDLAVQIDEVTAALPPGSPVLDATLHLLGLVERPIAPGVWRVRSAATLRRLLPGLRRDIATQTCFPTYGTPLGAVLAWGFNVGMTAGTSDINGVQYPLNATMLWYNTWYFHGAVGARLSSGVLPRFTLAGGPLFFRSPGDGAVGAGLHIEVEVPVRDAQRDPLSVEAARSLWGFEVQGLPYFTNGMGMHLALAAGLTQHGDLTRAAPGFGISFTLGLSFGRLRWDRPE